MIIKTNSTNGESMVINMAHVAGITSYLGAVVFQKEARNTVTFDDIVVPRNGDAQKIVNEISDALKKGVKHYEMPAA